MSLPDLSASSLVTALPLVFFRRHLSTYSYNGPFVSGPVVLTPCWTPYPTKGVSR